MIGPKQLVRLDILGCPIIRSAKIVLQRGDILYLPRRVYCKGNFKPSRSNWTANAVAHRKVCSVV